MSKDVDRIDVLLSIITAAEGDPITPVQLQKIAFLVGEECREILPQDFYKFVAYDYGPFCIDIYRDAEKLQEQGSISIDLNSEGRWNEYSATFRSNKELAEIPAELDDFIQRAVEWATGLTFRELVSSIYHSYPQYAENSIFKG